jgi:hypothetical protein
MGRKRRKKGGRDEEDKNKMINLMEERLKVGEDEQRQIG